MTAPRLMVAAALLIGLAACSSPDQRNEQLQADNVAAGLEATDNGAMSNRSGANAAAADEPSAEGDTSTSGMPIVNHPEVNEHIVYNNDEATPDR